MTTTEVTTYVMGLSVEELRRLSATDVMGWTIFPYREAGYQLGYFFNCPNGTSDLYRMDFDPHAGGRGMMTHRLGLLEIREIEIRALTERVALLTAENARLNKVVDQAIECSQMSIKAETELCLGFSSRTDVLHEVIRCWYGFGLLGNAPELAAELERRSKA